MDFDFWTESVRSLVVLGVGFVVAWFAAEGLARRTLARAGVLFAVLGVVAGPEVLGVLGEESLGGTGGLGGLAGLLVGWVGLQVGLGLAVRKDGGLVEGALRAGVLYAVLALAILGSAAFALLLGLLGDWFPPDGALLAAAAIAASGTAGSPHAVGMVAERFGARGVVKDAGQSLARVARGGALVAFAIALALHGLPHIDGLRVLAPAEWLVGEVLVGLAVGLLADTFLGDERDDRRLVLVLGGVSAFATGVSWHLGLSPIFLNLVIGFTLANFGRREAARHDAVTRLETAALYTLLVYAGAAWVPPDFGGVYAVAAALVALRAVMVWFAGGVAARALDPQNPGLRKIGFTLVGQGAPSVSLAVAYALGAGHEAGQLVLTVILASTLLNDLWAGPAARVVLDEAGEIPTLPAEAP